MRIRDLGILAGVMAAALLSPAVRADTVVMKDGSVRTGVITKRTDSEVWLRIDWEGIRGTVEIPKENIAKITEGPVQAPEAATQPAAVAAPLHTPVVLPESLTKMPPSAERPDDPTKLPEVLADLWKAAVHAEAMGEQVNTLGALRDLNDAFEQIPDGMNWLNAITLHERKTTFGAWFADVHYALATASYRGASFDLKDVREVERPILIQAFKGKTGVALEPLRQFFPPIDAKTNRPAPATPQQLAGIGAQNAIEVKDKAQYASAVLLAQLRLEPQMPALDRMLLVNDLQTVRRILNRAIDLEPLAHAAQEKAERDKRIADEQARREARKQLYASPR